jgi:CRISPR type I-D-associated protein Csc1
VITTAYIATLLSPLNYRTRPDSGAGGASVTGDFLGDIALNYAIEYAQRGGGSLWEGRIKTEPNYEHDMSIFEHRCTVGVPLDPVEMMPIEYQATSFVSEGYPSPRIYQYKKKAGKIEVKNQSGSSSLKGWMQRQALAPFNRFGLVIFSHSAGLPSSFTIRMGNGRETLIRLDAESKLPEHVTLNAFTVSHVLKRPMPDGLSVEMENARYLLVHGVPLGKAGGALGW